MPEGKRKKGLVGWIDGEWFMRYEFTTFRFPKQAIHCSIFKSKPAKLLFKNKIDWKKVHLTIKEL